MKWLPPGINQPENMTKVALLVLIVLFAVNCECILRPQESETREIKPLDGIWNFRLEDYPNQGFEENWFDQLPEPTVAMPVPSSYNDIYPNITYVNYLGWAWYQRQIWIPPSWRSAADPRRIVLRFDAAHYFSMVWVNGTYVTQHAGGHLPFEADITDLVSGLMSNVLVTVAVNNSLNTTTLPPGEISWPAADHFPPYPPGYHVLTQYFDFFNYAGIDRPVKLYTTARDVYFSDVNVLPDVSVMGSNAAAVIDWDVSVAGSNANQPLIFLAELFDANGNSVGSSQSGNASGSISLSNAQLWWPVGSAQGTPYLYTLQLTVKLTNNALRDSYRLKVGLRSVSVSGRSLLINSQPFYLHGVNKHDDSDLRGKGFDTVLVAKDFALINWLNANAFRTSHYPYPEEVLDMADEHGIVVISESTAVGLGQTYYFSDATLAHHIDVMQEMITRDKNRASVIMWSIANEPLSSYSGSVSYFTSVVNFVRAFDISRRPVTMVMDTDFTNELNAALFDVLCINRYYGWYSDTGHLEVIQDQLVADVEGWASKYDKPIIVSEYGADTVEGLHNDPPFVFTEDFQSAFLREYHAAFDTLREKGLLIGELIWNFADFATQQADTRIGSLNRKGVFTRNRKPKAAAYVLQQRYSTLVSQLQNIECTPLQRKNETTHSTRYNTSKQKHKK